MSYDLTVFSPVRFSLRVKPRRRRTTSDWIGELPDRVRAEATVITLAPADYDRYAERIRRTGTAAFEFVFAPARREIPGAPPADCFVITDGNQNYIELRRAPA